MFVASHMAPKRDCDSIKKPISLDRPEAEPLRRSWSPPVALHLAGATMADMGGQIDKMVSFIHFEAKNKKEEILAKAKQDKEAKKLELVHREKLKIDADFNKRIKNVDTQNKMCAPRPLAPPPFAPREPAGRPARGELRFVRERCEDGAGAAEALSPRSSGGGPAADGRSRRCYSAGAEGRADGTGGGIGVVSQAARGRGGGRGARGAG